MSIWSSSRVRLTSPTERTGFFGALDNGKTEILRVTWALIRIRGRVRALGRSEPLPDAPSPGAGDFRPLSLWRARRAGTMNMRYRDLVPDGAMGPNLVVVSTLPLALLLSRPLGSDHFGAFGLVGWLWPAR
jgi:hypothetical protein